MLKFVLLGSLHGNDSVVFSPILKVVNSVVSWNIQGNRYYNTFDTETYIQEVSLEIACQTSIPFDYFVTFSAPNNDYKRNLKNSNNQLVYQLFKDPNQIHILKGREDVTQPDSILIGRFEANSPQIATLNYYFSIPPLQLIAPGNYTDTLELKIYKGRWNDSDAVEIYSVPLHLVTTVNHQMEISLSSKNFLSSFSASDNMYILDFGSAEPGKTKSFNLYSRSNTPYSICFESENNGVLQHDKIKNKSIETKIPYSIIINNIQLSLDSDRPKTVIDHRLPTDHTGVQHTVDVTLNFKTIKEKIAGSYTDTIWITAISN
jgi:spore coat protein U-like protein